MEADRFDDITRALSEPPSRRGIARALAGLSLVGGVSALLGPADAWARKKGKGKKKKKKCKSGTKKCGKTCISATSCCSAADCSSGGACAGGTCVCAIGFRSCQVGCIPTSNCCTDGECGAGERCQDGSCVVLTPFCAGKDFCTAGTAVCQSSGSECGCFVDEESGDPFCGQTSDLESATDCSQCAAGRTCVSLPGGAACGSGLVCMLPCPNPL